MTVSGPGDGGRPGPAAVGAPPRSATIDPAGASCKASAAGRGWSGRWIDLLLAYLLVAFPLLLLGSTSGETAAPAWALLAAHAAMIAWVAAVRADRVPGRPARIAAEWTLPAVFPLLYAELPLLMAALPGPVSYRDSIVRGWERALFGGEPAFAWASAVPVPWLSELLHFGYLLYYPLIYVPPALLWLGLTGPSGAADRAEAFHRTVLALGVAMLGAFAVMVVWPVQGPRYLGVPAGVPDGPFRSLVLMVLESGSSRGAAFPSSHVSVAVAQTVLALRFQPRVGTAAAVATTLLSLGAVYGGFHYVVDVVAGVVLGGLAAGVALRETPHPERG